MRVYLENFLAECEYRDSAIHELMSNYDKLVLNCKKDFEALISEYESSYDIDYTYAMEKMKELSLTSGVHEYTGALLLFLCYTRGLRKYYDKQGISHEIFRDTVLDLRYKLDECLCVKGVCGSFVAKWFVGFFKLERFALGRLQFEIIEFGSEYNRNGLHLSPDSRVLNVHIPRTGTRLDRESTLDSYKRAADFYRPILGDKIAFVCSSWLLFPKHNEILGQKSNLLTFINDYDIIASGEYLNYNEVWRLFDTEFDGDVTHLPADSSLRRAYIDLISRGEKTGWGKGVFEYK
jgi:hypothetical protein